MHASGTTLRTNKCQFFNILEPHVLERVTLSKYQNPKFRNEERNIEWNDIKGTTQNSKPRNEEYHLPHTKFYFFLAFRWHLRDIHYAFPSQFLQWLKQKKNSNRIFIKYLRLKSFLQMIYNTSDDISQVQMELQRNFSGGFWLLKTSVKGIIKWKEIEEFKI